MSNNKESNNYSVLILGLLGIAFVVLKLCKVIDWHWAWVTCPFWGGLAIYGGLVIVSIVVAFAATLACDKAKAKQTELTAQRQQDTPRHLKSRFQQRIEDAMENQRKINSNQ